MRIMDLRGDGCPANLVKAKKALEMIEPGEVVKLALDDGESFRKISRGLLAEGHAVMGREPKEGYSILTLKVSFPDERVAGAPVREYASTKITRSLREPATDPVMVEEVFELLVNGKRVSSIVTTPENHKELAVGYMVTEWGLREREALEGVTEKDGCVMLTISGAGNFSARNELQSSGYVAINPDKGDEDVILPLGRTFRVEVLLDSMKHLYDATQDKTGGAHSASLVDADGNLLYKAIDIGRHNAIDKVVGMAFLNSQDLSGVFLVSSGRQPAGMVMKAARAGIPLIISKAAPISSGIDSALCSNITLCCYATGEKIKVFSAPERIV